MGDHTKEPWNFYDDTHDGKTNRIEIVALGKTIARIYQSVQAEDLPNARRIVACVNACAGIPIESLELGIFADGNLAEAVKGRVRITELESTLAKSASREAVLVEAIDCCYRMLISEADTRQALFKAENILRDAIAKIKIKEAS